MSAPGRSCCHSRVCASIASGPLFGQRRHLHLPVMYLQEPDLLHSPHAQREGQPGYQHGFGNHHVSEALPGALPRNGTNMPQKCAYNLYPEHMNGTSFISSRETAANVWMYRLKPGVAHRPPLRATPGRPQRQPSHVESCFLPLNPNVCFTPLAHTWGPLPPCQPESGERPGQHESTPPGSRPSGSTTFVQGIRTVAGHGDATLKEGLAVHLYALDKDMRRGAFVNHDGELLIVPQLGTLDVQTELGHLRVCPGEICVMPAGFRFAVRTAPEETPLQPQQSRVRASGYLLELFGSRFGLPELGPLGANGLAHVRDFQYPTAAFDIDPPSSAHPHLSSVSPTTPSSPPSPGLLHSDWEITIKLSGRFLTYTQPHTPFDVVAWHGRYAPYKYDLSRFIHLTANTDQLDPTAYCVLTAPSKWPGVSLVDFCVFGQKWAVATDTIRAPYYHRTVATEMMGIVRGKYGGSVRPMEPGGLSFEAAYMPHGESYDAWQAAAERALEPEMVGVGFLGFMFHISSHVGLTGWAMEEHPDIRPERAGFWDNFRSDFDSGIDVPGRPSRTTARPAVHGKRLQPPTLSLHVAHSAHRESPPLTPEA